jgi:putative endonuclease
MWVRFPSSPSAFAKASADLSAEALLKAVPAIALAKAGFCTVYCKRKMSTVYLIQSICHPNQIYIGATSDIELRLKDHNAGRSPHTSKYTPWKLVATIQFDNVQKANAFERYLKTGSGRAFAKRHFW